jgi:hypothetical protein
MRSPVMRLESETPVSGGLPSLSVMSAGGSDLQPSVAFRKR